MNWVIVCAYLVSDVWQKQLNSIENVTIKTKCQEWQTKTKQKQTTSDAVAASERSKNVSIVLFMRIQLY